MIQADMHMHTWFSTDSEACPCDMADEAVRKGLKTICFTDHFDKDDLEWGEEGIFDVDAYFVEMQKLQEEYAGKLNIRIGIELGLRTYLKDYYEELTKKYPFDFCLSIGYRLEGRTVKIIWRVENTNKKTMYFSIGGHPAFVCPIRGLGKQTDYRIRFDTAGPIVSSLIGEGGLLTEEKVNYVLEHQELKIVEDLFAKDALVMEHDQAHEVSLIAPDGNPYVTVAFEASLFGIWAPKGGKAPFVCIEPWYGRCDRTNFQKKLEEREWGNTLASGETFEASYTITLC